MRGQLKGAGLLGRLLIIVSLFAVVLILTGCDENSAQSRAREYHNVGLDYLAQENYDLAEHQFKLAISEDPSFAEAHINLGFIYIRNGWLDGAKDSTLRGLELINQDSALANQGRSTGMQNLGAIELQRSLQAELALDTVSSERHLEQAKHYLEEAVRLDPSNSKAQAVLAHLRAIE